jgi:flagellar motor component MotA
MGDASAKALLPRQESAWFVSDMLLTIGMIGTVLGFIYMLGASFGEIRMDDVESVRSALVKMGAGMSTALYTTAAGLICSLILKLQLFLLGQEIDHVLASG